MFALLSLAFFPIATYSLICLIKPLPPFRSRKQVLIISPTILIAMLVGIFALAEPRQQETARSTKPPKIELSTQTVPKLEPEPAAKVAKIKKTLPGAWLGEISWWGWPDEITRANDALTLFYIGTKRYYPVSCRNKQIEDLIFIRCRSTGTRAVGAIYIVTNAVGRLAILPLNGKAKGQTGDKDVFTDVEDKPIRVIQKTDDAYMRILLKAPLSKAIEEFQKEP